MHFLTKHAFLLAEHTLLAEHALRTGTARCYPRTAAAAAAINEYEAETITCTCINKMKPIFFLKYNTAKLLGTVFM